MSQQPVDLCNRAQHNAPTNANAGAVVIESAKLSKGAKKRKGRNNNPVATPRIGQSFTRIRISACSAIIFASTKNNMNSNETERSQ